MEDQIKNKIYILLDNNELEELQETLNPYVAKNDPFALYIRAKFSFGPPCKHHPKPAVICRILEYPKFTPL